MAATLSGIPARILGRLVSLSAWPIVVVGIDPSGKPSPLGCTAAVAATGTLTSDATAPADGETVSIGGQTYTFRTALTASTTANEVLIGANSNAALLNLIRAINGSGTPGTDYGSLTPRSTSVTAATSVTANAFAVTAQAPGTAGNFIATTETSTHLSWGGALMTGGLNSALLTTVQ